MLDSLAGSVRAEGSIDAAFDLEEFLDLAADFPELGDPDISEDDQQEADQVLAVLDAVSLAVLTGEDDSGGFALMVNDVAAFEVRLDMGPLNTWTDPMQVLEAEPFDAAIAARMDADAIQTFSELIDEPIPDPGTMITLGLAELPFDLPPTVAAVVDAFVRGEWAGISGTVDPGRLLDDLGVPASELEDFAAMTGAMDVEPPTRSDVVELLVDSLTFTRIDDLGGQARYEGTLHTRRFVDGAITMMGRMDPTGEAEADARRELAGYDLRDLDQFLTVTFDGDTLTSARINLLTILAEMGAYELDDPARGDDFRRAVRGLEQNRLDLVVVFSDHGQIANVLDGIDATTMTWDDLFGLVMQGAMMGQERMESFEAPDFETPDFEAPALEVPVPPAPGGST